MMPVKSQNLNLTADKKENRSKRGHHGHNQLRKRRTTKPKPIKENVPKVADKVEDKPVDEKKLEKTLMAKIHKHNSKKRLTQNLPAD